MGEKKLHDLHDQRQPPADKEMTATHRNYNHNKLKKKKKQDHVDYLFKVVLALTCVCIGTLCIHTCAYICMHIDLKAMCGRLAFQVYTGL